MKFDLKPSLLLACVGWLSLFAEGWLLLLRRIPSDTLSWMLFIFFFLVALMASAAYGGKRKIP